MSLSHGLLSMTQGRRCATFPESPVEVFDDERRRQVINPCERRDQFAGTG